MSAAGNVCPQCGASFRCGMEAGDAECWCARLPALPLPEPAPGAEAGAASCLCPDCMQQRVQAARPR